MDRGQLSALLTGHGDVADKCRQALSEGADFVVWDGLASTESLITIYVRRAKHLNRIGRPAAGISETIERLRRLDQPGVRLGQVVAVRHYQLFLTADASALVGCIGVDRSPDVNQQN